MAKGNSVSSSMIYKTLERYSVMIFQMVVQIIIARILSPQDYGIVAMMSVFIVVANVFIHNGFNMSIVQKKDATEKDYGTALTINMLIGVSLYLILTLFSGVIADFYNQPLIRTYMPVMALLLIFGSINSIQIGIANRQMQFRSLFKSNVTSSLLSGIAGVIAAASGLGVWALIIQQLGYSVVLGSILLIQQHWVPRFCFYRDSAHSMFSFGWKLLVAGLINQIYNELNSLVIGKKYSSGDLAFYTKGSQFPKMITSGIDNSIGSVMFSAFSKKQEDTAQLHSLIKKTIRINSYLVFPCLMTLAVIASPLIKVLLTDKWLPVVPYMQICCFTFAFHPISSAHVQAIAAVGRSDIRLKLEFIKKGIGILLLYLALPYGPFFIALSAAATSIVSVIVGSIACENIVHYRNIDTLKDILPSFSIMLLVVVFVYPLMQLHINPVLLVLMGTFIGLLLYYFLSSFFKLYGYMYLRKYILSYFQKLNVRNSRKNILNK